MNKLIAYHNNPKIKEDILKQLQLHYDADEIVKGRYWENGKGCAVGCTIHSNKHIEYESKFGIPIILARLEDKIFENLPNELSKEWPIRFMSVIKVGVDLVNVWKRFAIWLLSDPIFGVFQYAKKEESKNAIKLVCDLYEEWIIKDIEPKRFLEARIQAAAAYSSAAAAANAYVAAAGNAASAAFAVAASGAAATTYVAAAASAAGNAAAYDAGMDAYAYSGSGSYYAASAAGNAAAGNAAAYDAGMDAYAYSGSGSYATRREKHYIAQSEKLLELLKNER